MIYLCLYPNNVSMCSFYWISIWSFFSLSHSHYLLNLFKWKWNKNTWHARAIHRKKFKMCIQLFENNLEKKRNIPNVITSFTLCFIILLDGRDRIFFWRKKMCTIELLLKQLYLECITVGVFFVTSMDYKNKLHMFKPDNRTSNISVWCSCCFCCRFFFKKKYFCWWTNIIGNSWWLPI